MKPVVTLLATTALLIGAPAAWAGEPFTIGEGSDPHLVVDGDGTAHVTWENSVTDRINYCRVPRGANACAAAAALNTGAEPGRALLLREGANLRIVTTNVASETLIWSSADNGTTWTPNGAPTKIYDFGSGAPSDPVLGPQAGQFTIASFNPGINVWAPSLNASEAGTTTHAELPTGGVSSLGYDLQVAPTSDGGLVAVANNLANTYFWRMNAGADPSVTASWAGPSLITAGGDSNVAGGSSGTFVLSAATSTAQIHRWNGAGFDNVLNAGEKPYIDDITVGPAGGVAAIWRRNSPNTLRLALSVDGGASWGLRSIAFDDVVYSGMDVALADDNEGWATYEGTATPDSNAKRFIRLTSTADLTPPAPAPAPTPTPTPTPPPTFSGPFRPVTGTVKGATITFTVPRTCVQPGQKFRVTLKWKRKKRKGNLFVKVRRTDFYIGTRRVKIDRKAPFVQTLTATATAPRGSKITLRARAFIKVRRGKSPTKSIRTTITVCAS